MSNMKCTTKTLIWCCSLYISMKLAKSAMDGCFFVTYIDIRKHIMFIVQADHHNKSTKFHFRIHLKPIKACLQNSFEDLQQGQLDQRRWRTQQRRDMGGTWPNHDSQTAGPTSPCGSTWSPEASGSHVRCSASIQTQAFLRQCWNGSRQRQGPA